MTEPTEKFNVEHAKLIEVLTSPRPAVQYRCEVAVAGEVNWASNSLVFDSYDEAARYAGDLCSRWMSTQAARIVPTTVEPRQPIDWDDENIVVDWRATQ